MKSDTLFVKLLTIDSDESNRFVLLFFDGIGTHNYVDTNRHHLLETSDC